MGENSAIEWTDHTFNPWIGCEKVSAGCKNCYAERDTANRVSTYRGLPLWGTESTRQRTSVANWRKPRAWNKKAAYDNWHRGAALGVVPSVRPRVFCASLADIFEDHKSLPPWRADLWKLIEETPELDWLLLTKRPQNVRRMVPLAWLTNWPKHVVTGASVENQAALVSRVPELVRIQGRHFLSCEPILGGLDFWLERGLLRGIDWVIVGGESGPGARPMHPDWVRHIRNQCDAAKVPFFFKQWGEYQPVAQMAHTLDMLRELHSPRGTHARATLLDYNGRVLESDKDCELAHVHGAFPVSLHYRVGKKAAGRLLDGRIWDELPREVGR